MSNGPLNDEMRQELSGAIGPQRQPDPRRRLYTPSDPRLPGSLQPFDHMGNDPFAGGSAVGTGSAPPLSHPGIKPSLGDDNQWRVLEGPTGLVQTARALESFSGPRYGPAPNPPGQIPNVGDPFITPGFRIPGNPAGLNGLLG